MMARIATFVWLLLIWVVLLGGVSPAGFIMGVLLSAGLLAYFQPQHATTGALRFRPHHALSFAAFFAVKFVQANIQVAMAVLQPERVRHSRAVVAVPIVDASEVTTLILANAICLTPGTFVLETHDAPPTLYVHVLQLSSARQLRLELLEMERRIVLAFGPGGSDRRVRELMTRVADDPNDEGRHASWKPLH